MKYQAGVLGAGSWGSALTVALSHVMPVTLWSRDAEQVKHIGDTRTNPRYIPKQIQFAQNVQITSIINEAITDKDLVVIATPLSGLREMFAHIRKNSNHKLPDILWVCKGLEAGSGLFPHQIANQELENNTQIGALLGPSFAKEVALSLPTAVTLTSNNLEFAQKWIDRLSTVPNFRVYANTDMIGSEVGSAVKNIIAIAVGISDGLQLGYNARAALITRSLNELSAMVIAMGGQAKTIYGLTGIGDLILTCTGDLSRNRKVGLELATGLACDTILANLGHVAEGVYAAKEIYNLSKKLGLDMPIVEAVYNIIYNHADIKQVVHGLINRSPKFEGI